MLNILTSLRLLILAAILGPAISANAQTSLTSAGREFWFGFMPNYITPAQAVSVYVATEVANKFKVEIYGENGSITSSQSISLAAGQAYKFSLSVSLSETRELEQAVYHAIRVTSSSPGVVVGYSDNTLSTDAFLAIPLSSLGTEHYCASYYDDAYSPGIDHLGGEFLIVAPYDGTQVTITTTANTTTSYDGKTIGHAKGQTWSVNLRRGQTYLVQTTGWNYGVDDLTGSKVTSNKPIGFLSGHQRAEIELEDGNSKDHLIEMLPSTDHWGIEYVALPNKTKPVAGSYYRVISAENANTIKINDSSITLDAGEYAEFSQVTSPVRLVSTNAKRFLALQYAYEQGHFGDPGAGDATMIVLTPVTQFVTSAMFRTPNNAGASFRHYVTFISTQQGILNIRVRKGQSDVTLAALGASSSTMIPGTPYVGVSVLLPGDEITWSVHGPTPFTFTVYGYTDLESYGFPGPRSFASSADSVAPKLDINLSDECGNRVLKISDNAGIADLKLVAESEAAFYGATSFTENFELTVSPNFMPGDTSVNVTLSLIDHAKPATAAFYFVDEGGNDSIYYTSYTPKPLEWTIDAPLPPLVLFGDTICRVLTVRNLDTDSVFVSPRTLHPASPFRITPDEEYWLQPNDSLKFDLCFIPHDTLAYSDSISIVTGCYTKGFIATSKAVQPRIFAIDRYYGIVQAGTEICRTIELENRTELPVLVTGYQQSGDTSFHLVSPTFPFVLDARAMANIEICLNPAKDTGTIAGRFDWLLDRPTTFDKTYSLLTALALKSEVRTEEVTQLSIWPNPAKDRLNVSLPINERVASVTAIDAAGNSYPLAISMSANRVHAETASLPSGSYQLHIETNVGHHILQLVIKR